MRELIERLLLFRRYNEGAMVRYLAAVYEQGVLRPLEPLALPEHQEVRLTLDDRPEPRREGSSPEVDDRREEMLWLATQAGPYAGQWVALSGSLVVAHGPRLSVVSAAARAAGVEEPLLAHLAADRELPFGGW